MPNYLKNACGDTSGPIPHPKTGRDALREIIKLATDKRSHVLSDEAYQWLELKMRVVRILAKRGLAAEKEGKDVQTRNV